MDYGACLFICEQNSTNSQMAEEFAKHRAPSRVEVFSAGIKPATEIHPLTVSTMQKYGRDVSQKSPKNIQEVSLWRFDLAVLISETSLEECPAIAGSPPVVHWELEDPSKYGKGEKAERAFDELAVQIQSRVGDLFSKGYFAAFASQKRNTERIIDNLSEGVIAHDLHRIIFFFSHGAERLTGLSATQVVGRDCHEVFVPRLCGDNCSFCDGMEVPRFQKKCYSTVIPEINGERKELD